MVQKFVILKILPLQLVPLRKSCVIDSIKDIFDTQ